MKVRRATSADAESACVVLRRSITELCLEDHDNDPAILQSWLANKTPEKFREWVEAPDHLCVLATADGGSIIGVAYLAKSGEVQLNYVSPDARYRGVSSALIAALEAEAVKWGLTRLTLKSTVTAHRFYLERGYRDAGSPETGRSRSNIFTMAKALPQKPPGAGPS